jgi:SH3-like domain-containing protein
MNQPITENLHAHRKPTTGVVLRSVIFTGLIIVAGSLLYSAKATAVDYVSVGESSAILYDAPSLKAKKKFVVNRYMPFEQVVTLNNWVKVRDSKGELSWIEKHLLSNKRYVFVLSPLLDARANPDAGAAKVFQARQQVALERLESTGDGWVKVRHQDGEIGYVRSTEVWGD